MKLNRKINIYIRPCESFPFVYFCTTQQAKTCKEAKAHFLKVYKHSGIDANNVRVFYEKAYKQKGI